MLGTFPVRLSPARCTCGVRPTDFFIALYLDFVITRDRLIRGRKPVIEPPEKPINRSLKAKSRAKHAAWWSVKGNQR